MRNRLGHIFILTGYSAIVFGVAIWSFPAAVIVGGVYVVAIGVTIITDTEREHDG